MRTELGLVTTLASSSSGSQTVQYRTDAESGINICTSVFLLTNMGGEIKGPAFYKPLIQEGLVTWVGT